MHLGASRRMRDCGEIFGCACAAPCVSVPFVVKNMRESLLARHLLPVAFILLCETEALRKTRLFPFRFGSKIPGCI